MFTTTIISSTMILVSALKNYHRVVLVIILITSSFPVTLFSPLQFNTIENQPSNLPTLLLAILPFIQILSWPSMIHLTNHLRNTIISGIPPSPPKRPIPNPKRQNVTIHPSSPGPVPKYHPSHEKTPTCSVKATSGLPSGSDDPMIPRVCWCRIIPISWEIPLDKE